MLMLGWRKGCHKQTKSMKFFGFIVLLIFLPSKGNLYILDSKYYSIVKWALAHYRSHSAVLIYDGNGKQWEIRDMVAFLNLQKLISYNNFYFSSVTTLPALSKSLKNGRPGTRETVAALEFNENLINFLIKATNESAMTSYKWFLRSTSASQNLDKLTIPSDCEFIIARGNPQEGYEVSETYNVDRGRKLKKSLGRWTIGNRFHLNVSSDLFTRRQNFEGAVIKIATPMKDACLHTSFSSGVAVIVWCIHQTIWELLAETLNATTETSIVPDLTADFIENSDVELTLRSANLNIEELNTRSYVWPVFRTRVVVVTSHIVQKVEWSTYILPFSKEMWIIILVWVITCDLILTIFELIANDIKRGNFFSLYCSEFSFAAAFTICNQGVLGPSKLTGIRIIFTMMFVVPVVLFPGYSAILTSFLTIQLHKKPFQNLQELSRLKEYKIGWHNSLALEHLFNLEDMSPQNQALLMNNVLPKEKLPPTDIESIERMCKEKYVFLTIRDTVLALKPKCSYYILKEPFKIVFTSIEIKKNSWYKYFLDRCERRLDYAGLGNRIKIHAIMKHLNYKKAFFVEKENFKPIEVENTILPFAVLLLGVVSSVSLLALEVICFKQKSTCGRQQLRFKSLKSVHLNCL